MKQHLHAQQHGDLTAVRNVAAVSLQHFDPAKQPWLRNFPPVLLCSGKQLTTKKHPSSNDISKIQT